MEKWLKKQPNSPYLQIIIISVVFLSVLSIAVLLTEGKQTITISNVVSSGNVSGAESPDAATGSVETVTGKDVTPELIFVALVPLLVAGVVFNKLSTLTGPGGIGITMQPNSELVVSRPDSVIRINDDETLPDDGADDKTLPDDPLLEVLWLKIGKEGLYNQKKLINRLIDHKTVRYVVFQDAKGNFDSMVKVTDFWALLGALSTETEGDLAGLINSGQIRKNSFVITSTLQSYMTNKQAINRMDEQKRDLLPVVDKSGSEGIEEFVGVATRSRILSDVIGLSTNDEQPSTSAEK